jgi:hypothetical protein
MRFLLSSLGTQLRLSCPYTSQQNGKAERILRTVNDCLRTLLIHSAAPLALWAEALATATYLINRRPCRATRSTTPHELLFGVAPSYTELRVFGCRCFPNTTVVSPHKLVARSTPCVFIGYPADHRGYRCFNITIGRVITSRHVVFDEGVFPFCDTSNSTLQQATRASSSSAVSCDTDSDIAPRTGPSAPSPPRLLDTLLQHPTCARTTRSRRTPVAGSSNPSTVAGSSNPSLAAPLAPAAPSATPSSPTNHLTHPMVTRARAGISKPNPKYAFVTTETILSIPRSIRTAVKDPHWYAAMKSEFDALQANHTWTLVSRPPGARIITDKWVFKHKMNPDGTLARYKARWVVRGFNQRPGVDFGETFPLVVKPATIHTVLTLVATHNWPATNLTSPTLSSTTTFKNRCTVSNPLGLLIPAAQTMSACSPGHSMVSVRHHGHGSSVSSST